jgi:hypothetical protein
MENNSNDEEKEKKNPKVKDEKGLNILYDKEELKTYYPHLMGEISDKKKSVNIDSVEMNIEQDNKNENIIQEEYLPAELTNPGVIDFIRRCSNDDEAIEILDYLLKRKEITSEEYNTLKTQILLEGGLKDLIKKSDGHKEPGYYLRKYYFKEIKNQKLNTKKD